jgi:glutamine synthetase
MSGTASADAIWKDMQERGVEFVFAQFVDMYARPSAKLVPVGDREAFGGLLEEGAGFAGFAAGEIGQAPSDPDMTWRATRPSPGSRTSRASRAT